MSRRVGMTIVIAAVIATVITAFARSGESSRPTAPRVVDAAAREPAATPRFGGAVEDCSTRSEAAFPGAFTDSRNLVVGPLVLVGGAFTPATTIDDFGGNKFPVLVKAGHMVTVRLGVGARRYAGLAYGPLPQGETRLRDTYRSVTFVACRPGPPPQEYSADGPSGSYADRVGVTFWSGFVLTREPACIPLEVYIDGTPSPRRVGLALGRRCEA